MSVVERQAVIKSSDMPEEMQYDAILYANQAMVISELDRDVSAYVKKEFDRKYGPTWHCIAGNNFGSSLTHELSQFMFFALDDMYILIWRSA